MNISLLGHNGIITKKIYNNKYKNSNFITKLLPSNDNSEVLISKIISELKNFEKYFCPLIVDSEIFLPMYSNEWNDIKFKHKKTHLYAYNCYYGGYDLNLIIENNLLFSRLRLCLNNVNGFLKFIKKICLGLYFLHKNNIIHNDIKLENLVITFCGDNFSIKIIDFGLSDIYPFNNFLKRPAGTHGYIPINNQDFICDYEYYPNDWKKSVNSNKYTHVSTLTSVKKYIFGTDIFSLGITMRMLIDKLSEKFFFGSKVIDIDDINFNCCFCPNKKLNKLKIIISSLLIEDVRYRCCIKNILKLF